MNALVPQSAFSRSQLFEQLTRKTPLNELGLPKFLYRADLIPDDLFELDDKDQNAYRSNAVVELTYREGYPTFLDGKPIWEQMPHEGEDDYALFTVYRDLNKTEGYRQLSALQVSVPHIKLDLVKIQEIAAINFWYARCKAFDLFAIARHRKVREARIMQVEDYHFLKSEDMLRRLAEQLPNMFTAEKIQAMELKDFVKIWKDLTDIQRQALGLLASGGGEKRGENDAPRDASLEVILRQVAKTTQSNDSNDSNQGGAGKIKEFLTNPEGAQAAQELILKIGMGSRKAQDVSTKVLTSDEAADAAMITGEV